MDDSFAKTLILSCIPIRQLNHNRMVLRSGSSFILTWDNVKVIVTAAHVTNNGKNWMIELESGIEIKKIGDTGTMGFHIGAMYFFQKGDLTTGKMSDVDISFAKIPFEIAPYFHTTDDTGKVLKKEPRLVYPIEKIQMPDTNLNYGFFGQTNVRNDGKIVRSDGKVVKPLKYLGFNGEFYEFQLPVDHPGHFYFQGTSGAPILCENGDLVSFVSHGDEPKDLVYGFPLKGFASTIRGLIEEEIRNMKS